MQTEHVSYKKPKKRRSKEVEFDKTDRQMVCQRAEGICEVCKDQQGSFGHHIIPVDAAIHTFQKEFDGNINELISFIANCLWVCRSCHEELHDSELEHSIDFVHIFHALVIAYKQNTESLPLSIYRQGVSIYIELKDHLTN